MVSRWLRPGNKTILAVDTMVVRWWIVAVLCCVKRTKVHSWRKRNVHTLHNKFVEFIRKGKPYLLKNTIFISDCGATLINDRCMFEDKVVKCPLKGKNPYTLLLQICRIHRQREDLRSTIFISNGETWLINSSWEVEETTIKSVKMCFQNWKETQSNLYHTFVEW